MHDRPRIQRGLLRRALRKQMQPSANHTSALLQVTLDDEAIFETVYQSSMIEAAQFGESSGAFSVSLSSNGESVVDSLLKLLQWFVTNGPLLIQIIEQLIGLFGGVGVAQRVCEDETMYLE